MSDFIRHTARLTLRHFHTQDAAALFRLNSDPEVMRYTGDRPFVDPSAARHFIAHYDHYERNGFGRWAVLDRSTPARSQAHLPVTDAGLDGRRRVPFKFIANSKHNAQRQEGHQHTGTAR